MTTAILEAFCEKLEQIGVSPKPPIAYPNRNFVPPGSGMWLEARFFPNKPDNLCWDDDAPIMANGFFQVSVYYRGNIGQIQPSILADEIINHFKKGTALVCDARVNQTPWQSPAVVDSDRSFIPVTIPFAGLIK